MISEQQAYYQRRESLKKIVTILGPQNAKEALTKVMPSVFPTHANVYHLIIDDYIQCHQLQENPDLSVFCDVLIFAVDKGM